MRRYTIFDSAKQTTWIESRDDTKRAYLFHESDDALALLGTTKAPDTRLVAKVADVCFWLYELKVWGATHVVEVRTGLTHIVSIDILLARETD